jgi:cell division septal protein FtsQ
MAKTVKVKKRKLKYKRIIWFLFFILILLVIIFYLSTVKIKSIVVKNNVFYSDWQIIKLAGLENYPETFDNFAPTIEKRLEKNNFITDAKVTKKWFVNVEITVTENLPLFYYVPNNKTVLSDGKEIKDNFSIPTVINYIPDKIYKRFIKKMNDIDYSILTRMSEIKYDPNDVDEERFLITMNDGNYVYLTLEKYYKIDNYLDIVKEFNNKKGILYLDSGGYFKVLEG